jgi:rare lipoprotein A
LGLILFAAACAGPLRETHYAPGHVERGIASWYGSDFQGRPTANGEIYDMYRHTAAHRTMPLGTTVRVTNVTNGKETVLRINDRGPFVAGRVIDLSYAGAVDLDMVGDGTAPVRIEVVRPADDAGGPPGLLTVQVGAFAERNNAADLHDRLKKRYPDVRIVSVETNSRTFYRVQVGSTQDEREVQVISRRLEAAGFTTFITRKD